MPSFNEIPIDLRTPGSFVEFDSTRAVQGLAAQPHRALLVGQMLSMGTATPGVPARVRSMAKATELFGPGSQLAQMAAAYKNNDPLTELWAIPLADGPQALAASGGFAFSGTAAQAGDLPLYVGGIRYGIVVQPGDDGDVLADRFLQAVLADPHSPVIPLGGDLNGRLDARQAGTIGNQIDLRVAYRDGEQVPPGITASVVPMTGGAGDPNVADAVTAMGDAQYHTIASGWNTDLGLSALEDELERRWGALVQTEGHLFAAVGGPLGVVGMAGASRNSKQSTLLGIETSPTLPWVAASAVAALDAGQTQVDPSRPRHTLWLRGVLPASPSERLRRDERDLLLRSGVSTVKTDDGGRVRVEALITTHQTNAAGLPDTSWLYVRDKRNLAFQRFTLRARMSKFARHKLADDGTRFASGLAIVTPSVLKAEILSWFKDLEFAGHVEGFEQFKKELVVERDPSDRNRVNAGIPPDLVNGFGVFAAQIQFLL